MGTTGPRQKFWVVLAGREEGMPLQFDQLHKPTIGGGATHHVARFKEQAPVGIVELKTMAVALIHHLFAIEPIRQGVRGYPTGGNPEAHGAAEVDNILRFEKDFPGAHVVRLERNYRSTEHILAAASGLIAANRSRLGKTLWTEDDGGEKVQVRGIWDGEAEARFVAEEIENWSSKGRYYSDAAVLVRASWQMRAFEDRFIMLGPPYKVIGGPRFFERAEVRDAHAYLRLVRSPEDDLAFERIVNTPKRGIGDTTVQKIAMTARAMAVPSAHYTTLLVLAARTPLCWFLFCCFVLAQFGRASCRELV